MLSTVVTITGSMIIGCHKSDERTPKIPDNRFYLTNTSMCSPENASNPEDNAGIEHNTILDGILHSPHLFGSSYAQIAYATQMWADANGYTPDIASMSINVMQAIDEDCVNNFQNVIQALHLSDPAKNYLIFIASFSNINEEDFSYCNYKAALVNKEAEIYNNSSLEDYEKRILLQSYSIARYSAFYTPPPNVNTDAPSRRAIYDCLGFVRGYELAMDNELPQTECDKRAMQRAAEASACCCL